MSIRFIFYLPFFTFAALVAFGCGGSAPHPEYAPDAMEAKWDVHHEEERNGSTAEALLGYQTMCGLSTPYVRACFDYARLLFKTAPVSDARAAASQVILRFPDSAHCQSAVKRLKRSYKDDPRLGMSELSTIAEKIDGKECHDTLIFENAKLARSAEDQEAEIGKLKQLIKRYDRWESQLWDDATWRLATIYRETGQTGLEKKILRSLLNTRAPSVLIGSYTSPYHDDALLRVGEIQLEEGKANQAQTSFMELWQQKTSPLREAGLLGAARAKHALGDHAGACRLVARILLELDPPRRVRRDAETVSVNLGCAETR